MNWYHFLEFESEVVKKIDFGEAVMAYSKAVLEHPQWAQAWMNRACAYMELGDKKNALADADMAVQLQMDAETLTMRGRLCLKPKKLREGEKYERSAPKTNIGFDMAGN